MFDRLNNNKSKVRCKLPVLELIKICLFKIWNYVVVPKYLYYFNRKNGHKAKLSTFDIVCLLLLQVYMQLPDQRGFYRFIRDNRIVSLTKLPSISRFNRICNRTYYIFREIERYVLSQQRVPPILIMDSFPMPLCKHIRMNYAKRLNDVARIGYNGTKRTFFYGCKANLLVDLYGVPCGHIITSNRISDEKTVKPLLSTQYKSRFIIADKGYINKAQQQSLKQEGITFWTPYRKNTKEYHNLTYKQLNTGRFLCRLRRRIECTFHQLCVQFDIEHNRAHTKIGFAVRFEQCIIYCILKKLGILKL